MQQGVIVLTYYYMIYIIIGNYKIGSENLIWINP